MVIFKMYRYHEKEVLSLTICVLTGESDIVFQNASQLQFKVVSMIQPNVEKFLTPVKAK